MKITIHVMAFAVWTFFAFYLVGKADGAEIFTGPFDYLFSSCPVDTGAAGLKTARWYIKPVVSGALLKVTRADTKELRADLITGMGAGLSWQRIITRDGKPYSSFSVSGIGLFAPVTADIPYVRFSGAILLSTLNELFGVGLEFDGIRPAFILTTNWTINK
jgi:hypothetical protein